MRSYACLLLLLGSSTGCGAPDQVFVGELTAPVVYGSDDRLEVFNHPDEDLRRIAQESIVALIPTFHVSRQEDGRYALFAQSLGDLRGLCTDEAFRNQPAAAACSGVLIDDDLVLTAGHCIDSGMACGSYAYVFNYYLDGPDRLAAIRDEDVYSCAGVVSRGTPRRADQTPDFVIVQLDRPVEGGHAPVAIRPATALREQEPIAMIGFGSGLPAKIDSGATVADPRAAELDFFVANLDAFQGHSGSATFDSEHRLAGILISGRTPDYVTLEGESCERVSVYEDSQAGEVVHNVGLIVGTLCGEGWPAEALCDPKACDGQSCGIPPPPPVDPGVVPAAASGCNASGASTAFESGWMGLLLFVLAWRLRRPTV